MKVSLKGLLNKPRGSAWPPSARAVRCPVIFSCGKCTGNSAGIYRESGNERDLYLQLLTNLSDDRAHCRNCLRKEEEGAGNGRSVCSESPGLHARNNGKDNVIQLRKEKLILETLS